MMNQYTLNSDYQFALRPGVGQSPLDQPLPNGSNFSPNAPSGLGSATKAPYGHYSQPDLTDRPSTVAPGPEKSSPRENVNFSSVIPPHPSSAGSLDNLPETMMTKLGITASKLELWKRWGLSTMKCTRQLMAERFGKGVRTIDLELESRIEMVKDLRTKYGSVMRLARSLTSHTFHAKQAQAELSDVFTGLASKSPELQEEFTYNAETQRLIVKNMELFIQALNFFVSNIDTLVNKTIEDTLITVKQYEATRLEFDAHRSDLEELQNLAKTKPVSPAKIEEATENFNGAKDKFDKIRNDLSIKLKFLDENRIKVIRKQLMLFHNAISAYYTGNQAAMEAVIKQYSIKSRAPNSAPSWLETFTL